MIRPILQCTDRDSDINSNKPATQCAGLNDLSALPDDFGLEYFSSKSLKKDQNKEDTTII
jgi:hypothetical protein